MHFFMGSSVIMGLWIQILVKNVLMDLLQLRSSPDVN